MVIGKPNNISVNKLTHDLNSTKRERDEYRKDNDFLRNQNMMLLETLDDLCKGKEYWSEDAIKSGMVWRLENVLNQIRENL